MNKIKWHKVPSVCGPASYFLNGNDKTGKLFSVTRGLESGIYHALIRDGEYLGGFDTRAAAKRACDKKAAEL